MKSLILVSNRLPFVINVQEDGKTSRVNSAGGLVTALTPLVINTNGYWIGWAGKDFAENMTVPESDDPTSMSHNLKASQIVPIVFDDDTYKNYYLGMCNSTLWPLW
jgi:trehalose-6-phosphate synthase